MFKSRNLHVYFRNHQKKSMLLLYTHLRNVAFNTITAVDGKIIAYLSGNILLSTLDFLQINT